MKTTALVLLLVLSLAANAAWFFQRRAPAPSRATPGPDTPAAGAAATGPAGTAAAPASRPDAARTASTWANLSAGDLPALIARLRAAGFPPAMIRAIIAAQVREQFSARRKALLAQQEEAPFWKAQPRYYQDPATMAALREMGREQNKLLKDLLGADNVPGNEEAQAFQRRQYGDLVPDKLEQVQSIVGDYSDLRSQVYTTANGILLPEDREKLALLEKEQRTDLAAILTPQELEDLELRSSNTANLLRSQLGTFAPSEDEFRAIFRATQAAEDQYGSLAGGPTNPGQIRQIQNAVLDAAKGFLPPDRYAALQQATDPAYQTVNRLVTRLALPAAAATQVVGVQQEMMQRAGALRADQSLTTDQRNVQLSALNQEATTRLSNALGGARGLDAYRLYGGQWLQMLQPRPVPPPKG